MRGSAHGCTTPRLVAAAASLSDPLLVTSIFDAVAAASAFFERGSIGYSATGENGCLDCLELKSFQWHVEPLAVRHVESSFFADVARFPTGSISFDSALLMRGIRHEWLAHDPLRVATDNFAG